MGAVLHRLLQTIRFERDAYVWMDFNDRATGDALILVVVTEVLLILGRGGSVLGLVTGLPFVLRELLGAIVFWLVYAAIAYAAVRYLFRGDGSYATVLRITGFGYPTMLLLLFTGRVLPVFPLLAFLLGAAWFLAIVAYGLHHVSDLPLGRAAGAAGLGIVGWVVVAAVLGGGLL